MRHEPDGINRIAMKTAAELVINAAVRHFHAGFQNNIQSRLIFRAVKISQKEFQRHRSREFRRAAKTPVGRVKSADKTLKSRIELFRRESDGRQFRESDAPHFAQNVICRMQKLIALFPPCRGDADQNLLKTRHIVTSVGRKICAAEKRQFIGR
jgi:hypothetical protein